MSEQFKQNIPEKIERIKPESKEKQGIELTEEQDKHLFSLLEQAKKAKKDKDFKKAIELLQEFKEQFQNIEKEQEPVEVFEQKELKEQYEEQKDIYERIGLLEKLSTGELGIKDINGQEYAFPSFEQVKERIKEKQEILKTKSEQGFNQLLIAPFGLSLKDLIEKQKQVILEHHKKGKLLATKKHPSDPDEPLELKESEPVWVSSEYEKSDLVYFPERFEKDNHEGKTKEQVLEEQGAWNILFIEDLPNLPREGEGETKKDRKQLEANKSSHEYLELLKEDPQYMHESGMTPEEWISYFILHLEKTNQVIDNWQGNGSICRLIGSYFVSGEVPGAAWYRGNGLADLDEDDPVFTNSNIAVRPAVRI
jgi:hypothetical protein